MIGMIRHCPDCGQDRPFEQPHPFTGECPDAPDDVCPEWLCADCGAAVLTGFMPYLGKSAAEQHRRAA
jgi:hypothetical protein